MHNEPAISSDEAIQFNPESGLPTCAVVILAYTEERWDATLEAVASVRAQQPPPDELLVVVDKNPELQARLAAHLPDDVRVVANHKEAGSSGGRNASVEITTSDVIVFLDDDAAAEPGWLAAMLPHYADPKVLGVGGRIDPSWATERPNWFPPEFDWVIGCTYIGHPSSGKARNLIGANMSFRRDLFDEGGFDTGMGRYPDKDRPMSVDDTEFAIRIAQTRPDGFYYYDEDAAVRHRVPPQRQQFSYFRTRCYVEGLAKAQLTARVGTQDGLSAERRYSTVILPMGVLNGLRDAVRGDVSGLLRAAAIIVGLAYTTAGYVVGSAATRRQRRSIAR